MGEAQNLSGFFPVFFPHPRCYWRADYVTNEGAEIPLTCIFIQYREFRKGFRKISDLRARRAGVSGSGYAQDPPFGVVMGHGDAGSAFDPAGGHCRRHQRQERVVAGLRGKEGLESEILRLLGGVGHAGVIAMWFEEGFDFHATILATYLCGFA